MSIGDINSNERGSGARYNDDKPNFALIPARIFHEVSRAYPAHVVAAEPRVRALEAIDYLAKWQTHGDYNCLRDALLALDDPLTHAARVFEYGAKKYAAWNWSKGMKWSIPVACSMRHAMAMIVGELDDPESGLPHEGHLACNIIMLMFYSAFYREGDDITFHTILPKAA